MKHTMVMSACLLVLLVSYTSFAQNKKVTILGSSTAAGFGVAIGNRDSAWAKRLEASFKKNTLDGRDTIIDNVAAGGYTTYQSMPTGYQPPAGRPAPDPNANVTYVLNSSPRPDVVIINYPTNDIVSGFAPVEMMTNLRFMFQQFTSVGIRTFISTSQPRNTTSSDNQRTLLRQLVDSIQNSFGYYSINFWDDLVTTDGTNMLRADLTPDGTHPNEQGHRFLFQRVQAKDIFGVTAGSPLPLSVQNWQTRLDHKVVRLSWHSQNEEAGSSFEVQRSADGKQFQPLQVLKGVGHDADYSWVDASPQKGKNFYRLKIVAPGQTVYTRILPIIIDEQHLVTSLYVDASTLHLQLKPGQDHPVFEIINASGAILKKQTSTPGNNTLSIGVSELPAGDYFLRIITAARVNEVQRFAILK
jgi:lysophospholipase L1-like esterase